MPSGQSYTSSIARLLRIRRPHSARVHWRVTAITEAGRSFKKKISCLMLVPFSWESFSAKWLISNNWENLVAHIYLWWTRVRKKSPDHYARLKMERRSSLETKRKWQHFSKTRANNKWQNCCELIKQNDTILLSSGYMYLTPSGRGPIRLHCAQ